MSFVQHVTYQKPGHLFPECIQAVRKAVGFDVSEGITRDGGVAGFNELTMVAPQIGELALNESRAA